MGATIVGFDEYHYRYDSGHEGDMCMIDFSPRGTALVLYVLCNEVTEKVRAAYAWMVNTHRA